MLQPDHAYSQSAGNRRQSRCFDTVWRIDAYYRIVFRKRIYATIDELQADLDAWLTESNGVRAHQGRYCYGKTQMQTFLEAVPADREKQIGEQAIATASA